MEEKIITDVGTVLNVIDIINDNFPEVMARVSPTNPHRDPYNYYMTGSCLYYAEILHNVFSGYANYCKTEDHAFVKIGNHYFDVCGVYNDAQFKRVEFEEYSLEDEDHFYLSTLGFGRNNDEVDNKLIDILTNIGKEALGNIIETKLSTKNTL